MFLDVNVLRSIEQDQGGAFYLLDTEQFKKNFCDLLQAFRVYYPKTYIAYSYKTNYTPRLCKLVDNLGGFAEVVSDMEYEITKRLGIPTEKVHFNGPYKSTIAVNEIILGGGIVNLDDYAELPIILELSKNHPDKIIKIGIRCNFKINDHVTSRFGFDVTKPSFLDMLEQLRSISNVCIASIQCHFASRALNTWEPRAEGICRIVDEDFSEAPESIDLGGGLFGNMKDSLKAQFNTPIPTYEEYAKEASSFIANHFANTSCPPKLFIEPGSALVGDAMQFVAPVVSIKDIRGKAIATLMGSLYNINPTLNRKNPPITVFSDHQGERVNYQDLDFAGFTCIESDYLYKGYDGPLAVGDLVVFENVGSYSIVLKPPFILPNFPIIELCEGKAQIVKRKETFDDLFHTFEFNY